ncbi:hypothetical protein Egran_02808, partial [Elaphomyces granulatus]
GGEYDTALQAASRGGHEIVVQLLLDKQADVNAQGGRCGTALQAASVGGHIKVLQMLLDKQADVNAQGGTYGNALQAASASGHCTVVQMLLDRGADVNARGGRYGNALQAASKCRHNMVVQMLLDRGADQTDMKKGVQMLLDRGADIEVQGGEDGNALYNDQEAVATTTNRAEDLAQEARTGSAKTPRTLIPNIRHPDAGEPSESDLQIRLRWELEDIKKLHRTRFSNYRKLISDDLDLYTFNVAEKERRLYNSGDWLAQLEKGHVMDKQYAILAHSVPFEFYPKARGRQGGSAEDRGNTVSRLGQRVQGQDMQKDILLLDHCFRGPKARQSGDSGGNLALVRTELYDPSCRVVQCSRCYQFGHVAAMCPSPAACPFCSLAHGSNARIELKNPTKYKCTSCEGPHAAEMDRAERRTCTSQTEKSPPLPGPGSITVPDSTPNSQRTWLVTPEKAWARLIIPGKPPGSL